VAVTLHVGYGTFEPVRAEQVDDHVVDPERYEISAAAAGAINGALESGRRIVAVGTTTTRALEDAIRRAEREDPQRTQSDPQRTQSDPQRTQSDPQRAQSDPQRTQSDPQRTQSDPQRAQRTLNRQSHHELRSPRGIKATREDGRPRVREDRLTQAPGPRVQAAETGPWSLASGLYRDSPSIQRGSTVPAGPGEATLFIHPGHRFAVVGALLTNFHLPRSSLLMLVSAFAGRELVLAAYREAVAHRYRFYSYGDAMLIL
jgi:hypothetical protein